MAWAVNGKKSIYNPNETPYDHFCKAYPHLVSEMADPTGSRRKPSAVEGKVKDKECNAEAPKQIPYWCRKKSQKKKVSKDKPLNALAKESMEMVESSAEEILKDAHKEREGDLRNVKILINYYAGLLDVVADYPEACAPETVNEDHLVAKFDAATQTIICPVCTGHSLMQGVQFVSPTCKQMIEKGRNLYFECWASPDHIYRSFIKLNWKEFCRSVPKEPLPMNERKWMEEDGFVDDIRFDVREKVDLPDVFFVEEEDPADDLTSEPSVPDDLPQEIFYSNVERRFVIEKSKKLQIFTWESSSGYPRHDCRDILPIITKLNILIPPQEEPAAASEFDIVSEFNQDMMSSVVYNQETAALSSSPDKPDSP